MSSDQNWELTVFKRKLYLNNKWLRIHGLTLNVDETVYIVFRCHSDIVLGYMNIKIGDGAS